MRAARKAKGIEEEEPPHWALFPRNLEYLWAWFIELRAASGSNGFGPNPVSHTEIASWAMLRRLPISPWEVGVIRRLDAAFREECAASQATSAA